MIIKSHIRGGFRSAADYLKEQGQNEKTRLVEISDPHAKNLDEAFRAMWAIADGTKAKKPLHHVSINPMKDERLTDKQVLRICEHLEEKYGYAHGDHQRVIVEHVKEGRQHFHVIWSRVSLSTGKPIYPYMHKKQSKIAARDMEAELGLKQVRSRKSQYGFSGKPRSQVAIKPPRIQKHSQHRLNTQTVMQPMFGFRTLRVSPLATMRVSYNQFAYTEPVRKANLSGMYEEQRIDFMAACEGKITWKQYFQRWMPPIGYFEFSF